MATKTRRQTPPGEPAYHRLTDEKRIQIESLVKEGYAQRQIAAIFGVAPSTICREKRRNKSKKGYRHKKAAAKAKWRLREKAAKRRKFTERMWTLAKEKLREGWSFEMFSGRMRREGKVVVSAEAFYQEYYRRQKRVAEGKSDEELPPLPKAHRKRHKRGKSYKGAGRGKIPGRVDICERPKAVESRARGGHCEGDLINGLHGTGNLVTIAERMTRFTFFAYVASKDCRAVSETILQLLGSLPPGLLKTLTFDNGKEFAKFHVLVEWLGRDSALPLCAAPLRGRLRPPSRAGIAVPRSERPRRCRFLALKGKTGSARMRPVHRKAPADTGYAAGVALAS